jgi:hypothetical protein
MEFHAQVMAACFFAGLFLIFGIGNYTLIKWITVSRIWVAISLIFIFIPNRFYPVIFRIHRELKILFGLFAMGPLIAGMFLLLNFLIIVDSKQQQFKVLKATYLYSERVLEVEFEIDNMLPHREARMIKSTPFATEPDYVGYQVNKGLFGFKTLRKGYLIYPSP